MPRMYPPHFQGVRYDGAPVGLDGIDVRDTDVQALEKDGWSFVSTVTTTIAEVAAIAVEEEES